MAPKEMSYFSSLSSVILRDMSLAKTVERAVKDLQTCAESMKEQVMKTKTVSAHAFWTVTAFLILYIHTVGPKKASEGIRTPFYQHFRNRENTSNRKLGMCTISFCNYKTHIHIFLLPINRDYFPAECPPLL